MVNLAPQSEEQRPLFRFPPRPSVSRTPTHQVKYRAEPYTNVSQRQSRSSAPNTDWHLHTSSAVFKADGDYEDQISSISEIKA